ncbi:3',5'-cyclic-nucleotide phosphodiesterase [Nocardioides sp. Soil797]|nr:3',5'-cyclic-nucleotide phosphodiesterase [Nocardioides sp. Soil797]
MPLGQYPEPEHVVAHLSDTHLLDGRPLYGRVDGEQHLREALARIGRITPRPDVLVFTGDLADRGEPGAYRRLRAIVEPAAAEWGAVVVWVMGNHDDRSAYAGELFGAEPGEATQDATYDVNGLRIISLDTSVPGYHHGELSDEQLAWLRRELATPAENGTILALHHPPIPVPMMRPAAIIELLEQDRLAAVLEGSDVTSILGGHFHFTSFSTFAAIPVSVASSTCYATDPAPKDRFISGVDGNHAINLVHVYADRVVHSVVPVPEAPEVSGFPADVAAELEKLSPEERFDLVSRKDSPLYSGEA